MDNFFNNRLKMWKLIVRIRIHFFCISYINIHLEKKIMI